MITFIVWHGYGPDQLKWTILCVMPELHHLAWLKNMKTSPRQDPLCFAIPHFRNTGGKILVMSSAASWVSAPRTSIYNASKAAMVALYETLRVELRSDIHITIATTGFVESEMTKGKHLAGEGEMNVDLDLRDVQVSVFPVAKADACAKAIVNSVFRGERYVTNPAWYKVIYWCKVLCPEVMEWFMRQGYLTKQGIHPLNR